MRRFDENATLDRLADRGKIDLALADALARAVAAAHAKAPAVEAEPWLGALARFIAQNDQAFREAPDLFAAARSREVDRSEHARRSTRLRPLLRERGAQGLVRRGHGDLHLGNIALIGGRPVPFDAIEFDPLIAAGDVFYDLAFLLMDLIERGLEAGRECRAQPLSRRDAARRRSRCARRTAAVHVAARRDPRQGDGGAACKTAEREARDDHRKAATTYFALACDLIAPPAPTLVAVGGLSGTGKSVLARALGADVLPAPGAVLLRSDVERKALFGVGETERAAGRGL